MTKPHDHRFKPAAVTHYPAGGTYNLPKAVAEEFIRKGVAQAAPEQKEG